LAPGPADVGRRRAAGQRGFGAGSAESEVPLSKLPGLKHAPGRPRPRSHLRFDRICQPWLKDLGKRWVRLRLTSGLSVATVVTDVQALTRFSEFLAAAAPGIGGLAGIDRPLLKRYLALG
jgi:hypothetical protein